MANVKRTGYVQDHDRISRDGRAEVRTMMSRDEIRKYIEHVRRSPAGPSLHAIIVAGDRAYEAAWRLLSDCVRVDSHITVSGPAPTVFSNSGATIKVISILKPDALCGYHFASILLTQKLTKEQRQQLSACMPQPKPEPPAPRPVFGL